MSVVIVVNGRKLCLQELAFMVTESGAECVEELNHEVACSTLVSMDVAPFLLRVSSEMRRLLKEKPKRFNRDIDTFIARLPKEWQLPIIARIPHEEFTKISFYSPRGLSKNLFLVKEAGRFPSIALSFEHVLRFSFFCLNQMRDARWKNHGLRH